VSGNSSPPNAAPDPIMKFLGQAFAQNQRNANPAQQHQAPVKSAQKDTAAMTKQQFKNALVGLTQDDRFVDLVYAEYFKFVTTKFTQQDSV